MIEQRESGEGGAVKPVNEEKKELRLEFCERCAIICDAACTAEEERDRTFQNMLRYGGFRPL